MNLTWEKKGVFNPTFLLKDGDQILWVLDSKGIQQANRGQGVFLPDVVKGYDTKGLSVQFEVLDLATREPILEAQYNWNARVVLSLTIASSFRSGTIRCISGEVYECVLQKAQESRTGFFSVQGQDKYLKAYGKKTVDTNMDVRDKVTAAVLLAAIAVGWRIGPFVERYNI
jgi:hypothetical protein